MNVEELEEGLVDLIGDNFTINFDEDGQVIIHTGLREDDEGELEEFTSDEDMEEDPDVDPDHEGLDLDDDE